MSCTLTGDLRSYTIGCLWGGINSGLLSYFFVAFFSQWWLRTRYSGWFVKYNYILAAALDGGTQVRSIFSVAPLFIPHHIGAVGHGIYPLLRCVRSLWGFSFVPAMVCAFSFQLNFLSLTQALIPGGAPTKTVCTNTTGRLCIQLSLLSFFQETMIGV